MPRRALLLALIVTICATAALPAHAKEPTRAEQLLAELEVARKENDSERLEKALGELPTVYEEAEKKIKRKLMREAGKGLESDLPAISEVALKQIIETKDGDRAWKEALKKHFPSAKAETYTPWDIEILKALYYLHPDAAIDPLLHLMKKGKTPELSAGALRILGAYELSRKRVYVLIELVKIIRANAPGKGDNSNPRFTAMMTQLVAALNDLTGQAYDLQGWGLAWKEHKKRPQKLFVKPLPKKRAANASS